MSVFTSKTLLITGGTGSFGNAVLDRFLKTDIGEIRIFSRDEKKQDDMRHEYQQKDPEAAAKLKFYIGDVRSPDSIGERCEAWTSSSTRRRSNRCRPANSSPWRRCAPTSSERIMC